MPKDKLSKSDKWMIALTAIIVLSGLFSDFIFDRQLAEMKSGSGDTHALAVQAKASSDSAKTIAEKAVVQAEATNKLAASAAEQAKYMRDVATQALAQAKATNDLAREARRSADIAKNTFIASNRPYIGSNGFQVDIKPGNLEIDFAARIRNFGTVPGTKCNLGWHVFLDGVLQKTIKFKAKPSTLFPGETASLPAELVGADYGRVMSGKKPLEVEVFAAYSGPSDAYQYCERFRFASAVRDFMALGESCQSGTPSLGAAE